MNILAIDTATSILSAALNTDEGTWFFEADAGLRHSEILMDVIETLMTSADLPRDKLEGVVCMKGPGSFTGLRIGFSAAKGLALSLGIPFAAVPTLDCMAFSASVWPGFVLPLIDAKQNSFFTALYRGGKRLSDFMDAGVSRIADLVSEALSEAPPGEKRLFLTGPDAGLFYTWLHENRIPALPEDSICLDPECRKGRAKDLLAVVKNVNIFDNIRDDLFAGPEYLRKSDAELHFGSPGLIKTGF
ncbi:MAG: tRNA (adenosine(37)-N6)-threonylcarbamoyltransferase complex dimerization subunit type 1 TsaB [Treponema sp.]|jgi:tRNA threonylcarbamoyladenosine biosynthesis protein TsaB|nr:tRNA (adenosine(37)-N6)-threonylcarbamoyltransferase complex dimerization subunit type 1 TsaB [Treponema sp.]